MAPFLAAPALAAPKTIPVQLGSIFSAPTGAEGFVMVGKTAVFLQNVNNSTTDIVLTALDQGGVQVWQRTIDSGVDEIATSITTDPLGNIWLGGSSAPLEIQESVTSTVGIDNPDGVSIESTPALRSDMSQLTLWKVTSAGEIAATFTAEQKKVPDVHSISATNSGLSIVGSIDGKPFLSNFISGSFGKIIPIGTSKTELNAVTRFSDGSSSIFGSSSETLAGKKVAGLRDGVLIKISKSGAITSLVRSSASKASRSWISGDSAHLVSGPVITGKSVETAITKFTTAFKPTWTLRLASIGPSSTLSANGNSYLAFTSRSAITGVTGWKPLAPSLLVVTFDSKGVIKAATALPGLVRPLSLAYSPARGVTGLATAADGTVSIFTLVSR